MEALGSSIFWQFQYFFLYLAASVMVPEARGNVPVIYCCVTNCTATQCLTTTTLHVLSHEFIGQELGQDLTG